MYEFAVMPLVGTRLNLPTPVRQGVTRRSVHSQEIPPDRYLFSLKWLPSKCFLIFISTFVGNVYSYIIMYCHFSKVFYQLLGHGENVGREKNESMWSLGEIDGWSYVSFTIDRRYWLAAILKWLDFKGRRKLHPIGCSGVGMGLTVEMVHGVGVSQAHPIISLPLWCRHDLIGVGH